MQKRATPNHGRRLRVKKKKKDATYKYDFTPERMTTVSIYANTCGLMEGRADLLRGTSTKKGGGI